MTHAYVFRGHRIVVLNDDVPHWYVAEIWRNDGTFIGRTHSHYTRKSAHTTAINVLAKLHHYDTKEKR